MCTYVPNLGEFSHRSFPSIHRQGSPALSFSPSLQLVPTASNFREPRKTINPRPQSRLAALPVLGLKHIPLSHHETPQLPVRISQDYVQRLHAAFLVSWFYFPSWPVLQRPPVRSALVGKQTETARAVYLPSISLSLGSRERREPKDFFIRVITQG